MADIGYVEEESSVAELVFSNTTHIGDVEKQANMNVGALVTEDVSYTENSLDAPSLNLDHLDYTHNRVYLVKNCATCDSPLTSSESLQPSGGDPGLRCSQSETHQSLECKDARCTLKFRYLAELVEHADATFHEALNCASCHISLHANEVGTHFREAHKRWLCAECNGAFKYQTQLDWHGTVAGHAAYKCKFPDCKSETACLKDLNRHQLCHVDNVPRRYPCPHCRKYRGENGFKRNDHLLQHIRNYHHIEVESNRGEFCTHAVCRYAWFPDLETLTEHMLLNHQSLAYECKSEGCDRVGMNGFARKELLQVHLRKEHPSPFQCAHPGCDRVGNNGWKRKRDMMKHVQRFHGATA
ncbi:hypothetical protein BGZ60DRAFT_42614 [Tricladium varicosporioides]|nr:hypothetical protein BGZ60DRAFT_42614 [Hymenoscyphus varicosporioides]